jgi:excisionase family DNA binding protein
VKSKEKPTRLISVQEAALRSSYKDGTIREWVNERRLPHVRIGRAIRIPEDALDAFIASNTIPAAEAKRVRKSGRTAEQSA